MGYSVSKEAAGLANHLNPGKAWSIVSREDNRNIVRSVDGMMADEYLINLDASTSVRDELEIYLYRKTQQLPLVRVIAASIKQTPETGYLCNGGPIHMSALVFTERISHTLADAPQISFPQALYVMSQALIGFSQLYHRVGPFEVTDRMIGITPQGFVKVWMSQNFARNHPYLERLSPLQTTSYLPGDNLVRRTEISMVRNILRVVEYHTENGSYPNEWELEQLSVVPFNFANVHHLIKRYITTNKIFVPDRLSDGKILRITKVQIENTQSTVQRDVVAARPTLVQTQIQPIASNRILGVSRQLSRAVNVAPLPIHQAINVSRAMPVLQGNSMASGLANLIQPPVKHGLVTQKAQPLPPLPALPPRSLMNPPGLPMTFPISPPVIEEITSVPQPPNLNTNKLEELIQPEIPDLRPPTIPKMDFYEDDFRMPQNNSLIHNNSGFGEIVPPPIIAPANPFQQTPVPEMIPSYENFKQDMYAGLATDMAAFNRNQNPMGPPSLINALSTDMAAFNQNQNPLGAPNLINALSTDMAAFSQNIAMSGGINNYPSHISSESSKLRTSGIPNLY